MTIFLVVVVVVVLVDVVGFNVGLIETGSNGWLQEITNFGLKLFR